MCTALYHIGSANTSKSKGRWELLLHNGNDVGEGGTTSNLNIFGYGINGMSRSVDIYDSTLANVPSVSLIQVDFGEDIGDLIKMRIEIDGNGEKPDYFLDYVEMKDIDTDERIEINVNSWLKWESKEKGAQAFRELVIFRGSPDTLPYYQGYLEALKKFFM
uniref:PLAT domain-containing protein n=1 Tax=Panagrolaimus superbus TaxID=310955 RepID=A0A914YHY7_9BILA